LIYRLISNFIRFFKIFIDKQEKISKNKSKQDEDILPLNFSNSQLLVCAINFKEKDYWLSTFYNNKEYYKDFDLMNNKN